MGWHGRGKKLPITKHNRTSLNWPESVSYLPMPRTCCSTIVVYLLLSICYTLRHMTLFKVKVQSFILISNIVTYWSYCLLILTHTACNHLQDASFVLISVCLISIPAPYMWLILLEYHMPFIAQNNVYTFFNFLLFQPLLNKPQIIPNHKVFGDFEWQWIL